MATHSESVTDISTGQFQTLVDLISISQSMQTALIVLVIGIIIIFAAHHSFSKWLKLQKI